MCFVLICLLKCFLGTNSYAVAPRQEDDSADEDEDDEEDDEDANQSRMSWQRLSEKERRREMYAKDDVGYVFS